MNTNSRDSGKLERLRELGLRGFELLENENLKSRWRHDSLHDLKPRQCMLIMTGGWNSGKTTLVNAMIGKNEFLPTGVIPTTSLLTCLEQGAFRLSVENSKEKTSFPSLMAFHEAISGKDGEVLSETRIARARLEDFPFSNTVLMDTPGFNAPIEAHEAISRACINQADAVVFVTQAEKVASNDDILALARVLRRTKPESVFLVINRKDTVDSKDHAALEKWARENYPSADRFSSIRFTNAFGASNSHSMSADFGVKDLIEDIQLFMAHHASNSMLHSDAMKMKHLLGLQLEQSRSERESLELDRNTLEGRIQTLRGELSRIEATTSRILESKTTAMNVVWARQRPKFRQNMKFLEKDLQEVIRNKSFDPLDASDIELLQADISSRIDETLSNFMAETEQELLAHVANIFNEISADMRSRVDAPTIELLETIDLVDLTRKLLGGLSTALDIIEPILDQKTRTLLNKTARALEKGTHLFNKLQLVFERLQREVDERNARQALSTQLTDLISRIGTDIAEELDSWWRSFSELAADSIKEQITSVHRARIQGTETALQQLDTEQSSNTERRLMLDRRQEDCRAILASLDALFDPAHDRS